MTPETETEQTSTARAAGIFSSRYLWITIGSCALVFLGAFESLAVTTIMPLVSKDLGGASLYALAFAGPLAVGVIGMVVAGNWSDRSGPIAPLYTSAAFFVVGLLLAGTATTMWTLVIGRLVQGLGSGAITVALYVVVARIYPPELQNRIFAGFAAAWVVPSLVGPFVAGIVAEQLSWHWVFLGVVGLVLISIVMVVPAMRMLGGQPKNADPEPWAFGRIAWAVLAAAAVLAVNLSSEVGGIWTMLLPLAAIVVALVALRPLVPRGTLVAMRGLPAVILVRGLVSAAFFGAEVYLPYLLIERHHLSPTLAGLALTGGALAWAGASWLQGRMDDRLAQLTAIRIGTALVLAGILFALVTAALDLPAFVPIVGWVFAGAGMGLMYPRLSVLMLGMSTPLNQGFNSSALSISDSLGGALSLASTGIVFAALAGFGGGWAFAGCFALAALGAVAATAVAHRIVEKA
ncbi:MFS transporter [Glaciihabitans sp. UYNi722]|uniref:MFS transporter n=1 Tax=Glaciihabitans sp. UYNi722 TaxID=3156344 RepID=UPI00339B4B1B